MDKYKPKYHIETRFEKTIKFNEGDIRHYRYEQIVEYCNGIKALEEACEKFDFKLDGI